jgi:hypothetical protein
VSELAAASAAVVEKDAALEKKLQLKIPSKAALK